MKLIFLGSGSAFTVGADNFQSNMIIETQTGKKLLLDCGSDIRFSLHALSLSYLDITDIYISHLHSDHVGGLEYIGFSSKFDPRCEKPIIYCSKDIASLLWNNTLSGGMMSIEGDLANLDTYFQLYKIELNGYFTWEGIEFKLVKVNHVHNSYYLMPSYGLFFEITGQKVFITTDTKLSLETNGEYYQQADLIFHDCETSIFHTPVHPSYDDLITLPSEIKQKMWLYGYQPGKLPNAEKDGFLGFVKRGQIFDFSEALISVKS
ncbi:MBL fold metallo-hydrolase [Oscillatoria salina]|uniref:MBL fold metallo-hydrolase n=1 Tax=Oscillatoria salina TaxID=331517 RepID=UPI0013BBC4FD|nr:MBL fold metallo-hydrolase [Oscillatoria salina]MBZ8183278.1 MBL fold metallo-hydrolase [Oscillatoria salina IIICB1]NET89234.1 MBL fold metallo-hydrolase [Kamptonema sp. SIO1D9]